jgi:hypothetical protein
LGAVDKKRDGIPIKLVSFRACVGSQWLEAEVDTDWDSACKREWEERWTRLPPAKPVKISVNTVEVKGEAKHDSVATPTVAPTPATNRTPEDIFKDAVQAQQTVNSAPLKKKFSVHTAYLTKKEKEILQAKLDGNDALFDKPDKYRQLNIQHSIRLTNESAWA